MLSGNSHNYERTFPLVDGNPVAGGGVTYVVSGAGGNGFNTFQLSQPAYSAFREATYSEFVKVTVSPTSLVVAGIRADTNTVFDSVTLSRGDSTPPTAPTGLTGTSPSASTIALSWSASTDNTGVTGYEIYRGTATTPTATVTGTTFTDTGLSPSTTYSYVVKAIDAAGNRSAPSNTATVSTAAGGTTITLTPTDDATIDPASTTPSTSRIKVDASAPVNDLLVKFSIPTTCTPTAATLLLTVGSGTNDPSPSGGSFYATSPTDPNAGWTETGVTWASAPAKNTAIPPVSLGAVVAGQSYPVTVTTLLPTGGGAVTIRGSSTSGDGAGYYSKEGSTTSGPRLQLSCR